MIRHMAAGFAGALALALGVATATMPAGAARVSSTTGDFSWHGRIASGRTIEIRGVNGGITAGAAAGDEVVVTAIKHAKKSDPDLVRIEVSPEGGDVTICAIYPSSPGREANGCEGGGHWHSHVDDNDVVVDFTVHVPAGVRLVARTVNGEIEATGLDSPVEVATVNGSVQVSTRRIAQASTVNGSIHASLGRADWTGDLEFHTVNGGITLELPRPRDAHLTAQTMNGTIESALTAPARGPLGSRNLSWTIGRGGRGLALSTVNGSIRLKFAGAAPAGGRTVDL